MWIIKPDLTTIETLKFMFFLGSFALSLSGFLHFMKVPYSQDNRAGFKAGWLLTIAIMMVLCALQVLAQASIGK